MSSILVNTSVFHLSDDERKSALSMLLLLGLNHYTKETKTQTIDLNVLQRLHGKFAAISLIKSVYVSCLCVWLRLLTPVRFALLLL